MTDASGQPERDPGFPDGLADALARLQRTPPVPPAVDMAILASAGLRMRRNRRSRVMVRWAMGAAAISAVAAVVLVAVFAPPFAAEDMQSGRPQVVTAAGSQHPSPSAGKVTILQAFELARLLEAPAAPDRRWDINRDGSIDRKDVDRLAMAAVSLDGQVLQ